LRGLFGRRDGLGGRGHFVLPEQILHLAQQLIGLFEQSALLEGASYKSPLVKGRENEERFQLAVESKAIDPAVALAAQQALHENKKPAKAVGKPGKPPINPASAPAKKP
jgi:hypothetical protein